MSQSATNTATNTATITVTQVKSSIGTKPKHRGTLRALGLGKIGRSNTLPDRPEIRGMIARVPHLIDVTDNVATAGSAAQKES
jgi:large subunit ribosomal protein L30